MKKKDKIVGLREWQKQRDAKLIDELADFCYEDREDYISQLQTLSPDVVLDVLFYYEEEAEEPEPFHTLLLLVNHMKEYHEKYYLELALHPSGKMEKIINKISRWITKHRYNQDV